ncbi:hypothetical protein NDU88_005514 [Pleurodeles waltl]|uniref:Uncharacterized protein n=1 Tax=Pleurodeles waltl TaxID=8319 RepID=A0AAV7TAV6_PLEWA|nr:hypothetical protein NDU88_005514 [Pleurodeles waltl]
MGTLQCAMGSDAGFPSVTVIHGNGNQPTIEGQKVGIEERGTKDGEKNEGQDEKRPGVLRHPRFHRSGAGKLSGFRFAHVTGMNLRFGSVII